MNIKLKFGDYNIIIKSLPVIKKLFVYFNITNSITGTSCVLYMKSLETLKLYALEGLKWQQD